MCIGPTFKLLFKIVLVQIYLQAGLTYDDVQ